MTHPARTHLPHAAHGVHPKDSAQAPGRGIHLIARRVAYDVLQLHRGAAQGVTGDQLARCLLVLAPGVSVATAKRRIQEAVAYLREHRVPVGSDSQHGYYLCESREELAALERETERRISSLKRMLRWTRAKRTAASSKQLALELAP